VFGVVLFGELAVDLDELGRAHGQPPALEAREDLAGEAALHRIGLDEDESLLGHGRVSLEIFDGSG
jgi:hypothetical protein